MHDSECWSPQHPETAAKTIWNCDETAFNTESTAEKVLAKRCAKGDYEVNGGSGREYIIIIKPYLKKAVEGHGSSVYRVSDSAWMDGEA